MLVTCPQNPKVKGTWCENHHISPFSILPSEGAATMIHQCEARRCDVKLFKISTVGKQLSNRTATEKRNVNCVTSGKITNMVVHL